MPCKKKPVDEWIVIEVKRMFAEGFTKTKIRRSFENMHETKVRDILADKYPVNKGVKKPEDVFRWEDYPEGVL